MTRMLTGWERGGGEGTVRKILKGRGNTRTGEKEWEQNPSWSFDTTAPHQIYCVQAQTHPIRGVGVHPEETRSWFTQSEILNVTGSLHLSVLFCGILSKRSVSRQEARAASFPSWGLARRHVRERKELSLGVGNSTRNSHLAQMGRARNLLKPVTLSEAFTFPPQTLCPPPPPEPTQHLRRFQGAPKASQCLPFHQSKPHR